MSTDGTRITGFIRDLKRRVDALRDKPTALVHLRALDRALLTLERGEPIDDTDLAVKLDDVLRDVVADIEAEERAQDELHEQARDEVVPRRSSIEPECPGPDCLMCNGAACNKCGAGCWGRPAQPCEHDSMDRHEAPDVPVDSDAPAATFGPAPGYPIVESERPAIRVVVDEPAEVDERGEGDA